MKSTIQVFTFIAAAFILLRSPILLAREFQVTCPSEQGITTSILSWKAFDSLLPNATLPGNFIGLEVAIGTRSVSAASYQAVGIIARHKEGYRLQMKKTSQAYGLNALLPQAIVMDVFNNVAFPFIGIGISHTRAYYHFDLDACEFRLIGPS